MVNSRLILLIALFSACAVKQETTKDAQPVAIGLTGEAFYKPEFSLPVAAKLDSNFNVAKKNFEDDPSEDNFIWLGRREAYRYNYNRAIEIFSEGLKAFPGSWKLLRHRGHRYITVREFDKAIEDLQRAAELMPRQLETEPDGMPNRLNIPLSSTQFNVWYHLGLAHYLKGDFEKALIAYDSCMVTSVNDDLLCATADWKYMTLRRLNSATDAESLLELIAPSMNIIENESYHRRLLLYKGLLPADSVLNIKEEEGEDHDLALATQGYGVGNWYLYNGDTAKALDIFSKVVQGRHFSAFGFIAAESELARVK